jgi:type IX secretion system PorP/SprF family membrane protein
MKSLFLAAACALGVGSALVAQDMRFTQYNAIPTSLNPAYAGASDHSRLVTAYRNQWSALPQAYTGWHVAHDWYQRDIRSGFGVLFSNELAGSGALRNARAAFQYAYEIPLGGGRRIRPALQAALGNRSIDMSRLTFSDQLVRGGAATSIEAPPSAAQTYVDLGAGFVYFGKRSWVGFSADHVNRPDESLNASYFDPMGIRTSTSGGFRMKVGDPMRRRNRPDMVFAFNYITQEQFNQMDLGLYYDTRPLSVGVWYRGLPFGHSVEGSTDVDALSVILGYGKDTWRIGYSYDFTVSPLGLNTTGGSHELVLKYAWSRVQRGRPTAPRYFPCAEF